MKTKFTTLLGLVLALAVASVGCLFWTGHEFYWSGELVSQKVQHLIGIVHIAVGVLIAFFVGWRSNESFAGETIAEAN